MEHVAFVLKTDPAQFDEYKKRHENVHAELEEQFRQNGIHEYRIFFHEGTLFAYMAVDNFEEAMKRIDEHPANIKWQEFMSDLLQAWENGQMSITIPCVYEFTNP